MSQRRRDATATGRDARPPPFQDTRHDHSTASTERGASEEAVPLNLRSLALRQELRVPQVRIDLHWLGRQRADLGEDRFRELVVESVGEERLEAVLGMLDQFAASQDDASASGAKGKPE